MPWARGEGLSVWATVEITGLKEKDIVMVHFFKDREIVSVIFSLFQELAIIFSCKETDNK